MTTRRDRDPSQPVEQERQRILYITFDGMLEPLGRSQVLGYLQGMSKQGLRFVLISLERPEDLQNYSGIQDLERELSRADIIWARSLFHSGGIAGVVKNFLAALQAARLAIKQQDVCLIHARSYVPALIGWVLKRIARIPYVFDMRGSWIDELADDGRWFKSRMAYKIGKRIERALLKGSAAIVTLTDLQAKDLRNGELRSQPDTPIITITTCADYDEFSPEGCAVGVVSDEIRERLDGKLVVGLVGSVNASYRINESLSLFSFLWELRSDAHLLCLTRQLALMEELLREQGIPSDAYTLVSANHRDMAEWLRHMDWGLLLLNTRFSKRGSMPTKLAEFFSAGVRPIQYGCNEEVSEKVRQAGSGIVLDGVSPEELRQTAQKIATTSLNSEEIIKARETTRSHFGLENGVARYAELLKRFCLEGAK